MKCRIFIWLALQFRLWTLDRRARHGLQDEASACYTCLQETDTVSHILVGCVYSRQVWFEVFQYLGIVSGLPQLTDTLSSWWFRERKRFCKKDRRGFDTLVILACWRLWKQRNARAFNNVHGQFSVLGLRDQIVAEWVPSGK